VQFTDQSTNNPTSWKWEYSTGGTWTQFSTSKSPSYQFTSAGTYSIRLMATNAGGSNTVTKDDYIHVTLPTPGTGWLVTLGITSGEFNQTLIMGVDESATRGYDSGLDTPAPPDPPGATPQKIAYFSCDDLFFDRLSSDFKPMVNDMNPKEVWNLELRSNEPVRVSWDTSGLTVPEIQLTWKNGSVTESMKVSSGTTLPAGTYSVAITASTVAEMEIPIVTGWNLISVPYTNAEYTLPSSNPIQIIYWYNPTTRMYEVTQMNALVPGRAYWIASTSTFQMGVKGTSASPITSFLSTGWNLIGGTDPAIPFGSITIDPAGAWAMPFVYGYNTGTRLYEQVTVLTPGAGYWGAVTREATITLL
jgi:hypothetical protein